MPLTPVQRERVDRAAQRGRCSAAEAVRRFIDGTPEPAPVERVAVDPEQYAALVSTLGGIRTELNRGVANLYRLTRDSYAATGTPAPAELVAIRSDLDAGLDDLAELARIVAAVSPW